MKTCILVPAYNCARTLPELCARIHLGPDDEILVVDDASSDDTFDVASAQPRVHVVRNSTNLGYGGTSHRLYQIALERNADRTINIHGDLGHRPEDAAALLARLDAGGDLVVGSRLVFVLDGVRRHGWHRLFSLDVAAGMPALRILGHIGLTAFQNVCYGTRLHSFHEGMRACTRRTVEWIVTADLPQWYNYDQELLLRAHDAGLEIAEVGVAPSYDARARSAAPRVAYGLKVAWHAIREGLSRRGVAGRRG